jgi:VanZ family protein
VSRVFVRAPAPLALMGLIFFLSAQSDPGTDIGTVGSALAHAGEYFLLTVLWAWALAPVLGRRALPAAAVIALAYATSDEIHQGFVDGRDSDPLDVLVDAAGIALAWVLVSRLRANRSRRTARRAPARPA